MVTAKRYRGATEAAARDARPGPDRAHDPGGKHEQNRAGQREARKNRPAGGQQRDDGCLREHCHRAHGGSPRWRERRHLPHRFAEGEEGGPAAQLPERGDEEDDSQCATTAQCHNVHDSQQ